MDIKPVSKLDDIRNERTEALPHKGKAGTLAYLGLATILALASAYVVGCNNHNNSRSKPIKKDYATTLSESANAEYEKSKKIYDSIDLSCLSPEEKEWLRTVDEKEFAKDIKENLSPEEKEYLRRSFDIENPTKENMIFFYRTELRPVIEALKPYLQGCE